MGWGEATSGKFMSPRMPKQLGKSPLVEAIFEMRFEADAPVAGDLLPGLLYSLMKNQYPQVIPLALSSIPREIRDKTADLSYQPSHRLTNGPHSVQVGDRVLTVNSLDYPGWAKFKEHVASALLAIKGTELVKRVERFSFKYVNLIEAAPTEAQLSLLNLRVELIDGPPRERGFRLRVERDDDDFQTIIEMIPNTTAKHTRAAKQVSGLLITVDTIRSKVGEAFLTNKSALEEAHSVLKKTFFSLLTEDAVRRLEPIE